MIILGDTGSGKSYSGIVTGLMIRLFATVRYKPEQEPVFNSDTIVFKAEDVMDLLDKGLPPQSVIQLDEGGEIADARKWWSDPNDVLTSTVDTFRDDRLCLIWCTPDLDRVDKRIREEADVVAQMQGRRKMKVQSVTKDRVTGTVLNPYPKLKDKVLKGNTQDGDYANVYVTDLKKLCKDIGEEDLIEKYEKRKKSFINEVQKKGRERLRKDKDVTQRLDMLDLAGILVHKDFDIENKNKTDLYSLLKSRLETEYEDYEYNSSEIKEAVTLAKNDIGYAKEVTSLPENDHVNEKSQNAGLTEDFKENRDDYWALFKRMYVDRDMNLRETAKALNVSFRELNHAYRTEWQSRVEELEDHD